MTWTEGIKLDCGSRSISLILAGPLLGLILWQHCAHDSNCTTNRNNSCCRGIHRIRIGFIAWASGPAVIIHRPVEVMHSTVTETAALDAIPPVWGPSFHCYSLQRSTASHSVDTSSAPRTGSPGQSQSHLWLAEPDYGGSTAKQLYRLWWAQYRMAAILSLVCYNANTFGVL